MIAVVFNLSLLNGFQKQGTRNMVDTDAAGGHYVSPGFDLLDPTQWEDSTQIAPASLKGLPPLDKAEVLVLQGQIFPNNRLYPVQLRGVEIDQELLKLPLLGLKSKPSKVSDSIPVVIGLKMARKAKLKKGDAVVLKWRDRFGAVDALDVEVVDVADFLNPRIDEGIVWMRLDHLRQITSRPEEVSWVAVRDTIGPVVEMEFRSVDDLMVDLLTLLKHDRMNAFILWCILMFLAGTSVFNTQILNVFKRQKEIGTLMALGMNSKKVEKLFVLEGGLSSLGAVLVALVIGVPLFMWFQRTGLDISHLKESTIPVYESIRLDVRPGEVVASLGVIVGIMVFVAWLPVRKISRLDPALALRGKAIR